MFDTLESIVHALGQFLGLGMPILVVWWLTYWIPKRWARVYTCCVLVPAIWYVSFDWIYRSIASPLETGHWRCLVCGRLEDRVIYGSWVLRQEPTPEVPEEIDTRPFERWYEREIRKAHPHDWIRIGCHRHGDDSVSCYLGYCTTYYKSLPSLPNPSTAADMVDRIRRAPTEDRTQMIRELDHGPDEGVFHAIAEGRSVPREEFDRAFEAWLAVHPEWKLERGK